MTIERAAVALKTGVAEATWRNVLVPELHRVFR